MFRLTNSLVQSMLLSLGLLSVGFVSHVAASWPHGLSHSRNVGLWHTPISSVGQCYPRPVISHPAPFRCNPGFYIRRDACDYRWSFNYNRYCPPRPVCRPNCYPYYGFNSFYCPPTPYYGVYPVWYSSGISFGVQGGQWNMWNGGIVAQPIGIPLAARAAQPQALRAQNVNAQAVIDALLEEAMLVDARADAALRQNVPRITDFDADRIGQGRGVVDLNRSRSTALPTSLEDRLAQTREIMSRTYSSANSPVSFAGDRVELIEATERLAQSGRDTTPQARRNLGTVTPSKMSDGDIAFRKGYYHTAEIYYRQAGRDKIELRKEAAIRLACSQFARGDYLKAAQTLRWVNQQPTIIDANATATESVNPVLAHWKESLPQQQLASLFASPMLLEQHLNRLAEKALAQEDNGTELWLLGVLMGLQGDDSKSELFLTQASQSPGEFADTAKFLVDSARDQSRLKLAAQTYRSP